MELGKLFDRIYEAAFLPEGWPGVLELIGGRTGSVSGALLVFDESRPVRFSATPLIRPWTEIFCSQSWRASRRVPYLQRKPYSGFAVLNDYFGPDFMARDPSHRHRLSQGLDSEIGTFIPMPTGEIVVFSFDRLARDGKHAADDVLALNALHPHLARAGLVAAQLGLGRAEASTSALRLIGLPAAVLSASGRVISANDLFEEMTELFLPRAFGRLAVAQGMANKLFQRAVEAAADLEQPEVRSVPIPETVGHASCVLHVVPLRHNALDLFPGGAMVVAISKPRRSMLVPSADLLTELFDLTPAETRFAMALASGKSPKAAAKDLGVTESSGRTYLARIFFKTGTHRQTELVSLLRTAHPFH